MHTIRNPAQHNDGDGIDADVMGGELRGVVKVDLCFGGGEAVVARREYGEKCIGGEPFFVPRKSENAGEQLAKPIVGSTHMYSS
ncbi:hypothetical protein GOP47_0005467 [Adiantum capillus-veneris]|uniref:Uncharacterized protein n=1 Tax=Adiantum capillus-veneris TaxID=13818 RepID=A0A9D4ZLE7_ADICA|nr:hypothetical protein GOP47_0005467 [Adiantum capillus-veneris]